MDVWPGYWGTGIFLFELKYVIFFLEIQVLID